MYPEYHEGRILLILVIGTVTLGFSGADMTADTTGYLQVSSTSVRRSGLSGITPEPTGFINITDLSPREYSLVLKKPYFPDYISTAKIVSGQTVKVSSNLQTSNVKNQKNPGNPVITGVFAVIVVLILVGFVVLF